MDNEMKRLVAIFENTQAEDLTNKFTEGGFGVSMISSAIEKVAAAAHSRGYSKEEIEYALDMHLNFLIAHLDTLVDIE